MPVEQLGIGTDGVLRWIAPSDSIEPSAEPTYYMVYIRQNEGEWDVQQVEKETQLKLTLTPGVQYSFYVVAGNNGGLSFPSPMISAYINEPSAVSLQLSETVLILDAFNDAYGPQWFADSAYAGIVPGSYACEDGFSCAYIGEQWDYRRASVWTDDDNCGWGACYRDHAGQLTIGNTHDYAVQHGRVLKRMGISHVSCTEGMVEAFGIQHSAFSLLDVVCGRNRQPLTTKTQELIAAYLDKGGRVVLSSDHLSAMDAKWLKRNLHASYYAARATRSGRLAVNGRASYRLLLRPNEEQLFTCHPEGLKPENDAAKLLTYEDMRCPAAIGYPGKSLVFGFPIEAVREFDNIYQRAVEWLMK